MKPQISLIAAMSENRVIGIDNQLPWHIPEDLKYFKQKTLNKPIIMGRKTYESIGRLLPKRTNIILTGNPDYVVNGAVVVNSISDALSHCRNDQEVMIVGGAEIYKQMLPYATNIYLTVIHTEIEGDAYFPELDDRWHEMSSEYHEGEPDFSFKMYTKGV